MQLSKWGTTALALICGAMMGTVAYADEPVEKSHNTFHKAVCARGNPHETARCHAHVVTDSQGVELDGKAPGASPNAVPAGYGPADLRSAYAITTDGTTTIAIVDAYGYPNAEQDLGLHDGQRLLQEGQPERRPGQLSAARRGLGAGIGARPRHGQRDVPGLQAGARRSDDAELRQPRDRGPHRRRDAGRDRHLEQLWRQRDRHHDL
jgi:hypothetical protein